MTHRILAIDDEPQNLVVISAYLEDDPNYDIITAVDGLQGWHILEELYQDIELILLDRMMPNMDGIALTKKIMSHPKMSRIPIIMQTAAAEKKQVEEGIKLGVYYYLTKPYTEEMLLSIVKSALDSYNVQRTLRHEIEKYKAISRFVDSSQLSCRTLNDILEVAPHLANFFPEPERVIFGISELLANAIEHGNLGISYQEKSEFIQSNIWEAEVKKRLSLDTNKSKKVNITYTKAEDHIRLVIKDQGVGFDWQQYMELSPARAVDNHGRGIALSKRMSFDCIEYVEPGNEVHCIINLKDM